MTDKEKLIQIIKRVKNDNPSFGRTKLAKYIVEKIKPTYTDQGKEKPYSELTVSDVYVKMNPKKDGSNEVKIEETENEVIFEYNGTQSITSLKQALEFCKVDLNIWEVERHVFNSWDVTMKDKAGEPIKRTNYQCKVWFKRLRNSTIVMDIQKEDMKRYAVKYPKIAYTKNKDSKMLEISIYDLHYQKLAWGEESGENYDVKIASQRFSNALIDLLSRGSIHNIEKIVFVIGNDFFNSDGISNATTAGTPQDTDVRWQKAFREGRKLLVTGIETLMQVAPVEVVSIFGNHARQAEFYLSDAISCWFHACKNVTVDNSPKSRKYIQYGNGLLGLCHGDTEKINQLPMLMATENASGWASSRYREWHIGHLHHEKKRVFDTIIEDKSCVVRHLSSLSGTDAWHNRAGYVGAKQSAEAFVWDKENGIESMFYHNVK